MCEFCEVHLNENRTNTVKFCSECGKPLFEILPLKKEEVLNTKGKPIWCKPINGEGFWYVDTNLGFRHAGTLANWRDENVKNERFLMFHDYGVTWFAYWYEV